MNPWSNFKMTNEQKILLKLVSATLNGSVAKIEKPENVDWLTVAAESDAQAVLLMALDAAAPLKDSIPEEVYKVWSDRAVNYLVENLKVQTSQKELVKILTDAGFPYVIIKGEASAKFYSRPDLRTLGDVDFLIDLAQNDEITKLLRDSGYTSEMEDHECHTVFRKPDVHLEMHREISGIPHGETGEKVREFVKDMLDGCQKDPPFNLPQKYHHGLVLLLHTQHHLVGEGIGIRHLCDWSSFVNGTHTESFWEQKLLPFLREIGLLTFAKVLTKTCSIAFETPCPDWAEADENLCNGVLDDIFSGGNFGKKERRRALSGALITNRGKDGIKGGKWNRLYAVFKENIRKRHPITKKHPILYPFYAVYKAMRFFALRIIGKKPSLKTISKEIDERKNIYQQLKIFEV